MGVWMVPDPGRVGPSMLIQAWEKWFNKTLKAGKGPVYAWALKGFHRDENGALLLKGYWDTI